MQDEFKNQVLDILNKWEFFYGQKAGRDLWADKPVNIQEKDLSDFNRDINIVKQYVMSMPNANCGAQKQSLKASDVMSILNISRVTLCHYVKRGLIKIDTNYTGKQYRYNYDSVMELKDKK